MKLPPEVRRAMSRVQDILDVTDDSPGAEAVRDLLSELRRFEKKLEGAAQDVGVSTHALARVRS